MAQVPAGNGWPWDLTDKSLIRVFPRPVGRVWVTKASLRKSHQEAVTNLRPGGQRERGGILGTQGNWGTEGTWQRHERGVFFSSEKADSALKKSLKGSIMYTKHW